MPSPRLLKLLAEGLAEAPSGVKAAQELPKALLEGLKKTPELAEALLQVLSKVKAKSPGIADALQEAAAQFLSGQKTPQMIQEARKARSLAVGEHILGTGRKQVGLEVGEQVKPGALDPDAVAGFVPAHKPLPTPEVAGDPMSLSRRNKVEEMIGWANTQMTPREIATFQRKGLAEPPPKVDPYFPPVTASEEANILRPARQRLGVQKPQVPSQSIKAEEEIVPPGKQLWRSPKGAGKGAKLSPQEAQAKASETWEQMTGGGVGVEGYQPALPGVTPPARQWLSMPSKGYAGFPPQKGAMPEIRPGPTRTQSGPGVVPQKTYDPNAPAPKIEESPEDLFISPEVQQLYRRIILGKE